MSESFEDMQYNYEIAVNELDIRPYLAQWKENYDIVKSHIRGGGTQETPSFLVPMTKQTVESLRGGFPEVEFKEKNTPKGRYHREINGYINPDFLEPDPRLGRKILSYFPIFPNHPDFNWTEDNFGPLTIPEEGMTIPLTKENIIKYRTCIETHEGNEVSIDKDWNVSLNGSVETEYTFKMNYYSMMGDNRHNSADSRFWGFVPEDHVVGKAVFIWMSLDGEEGGLFSGGIRWNRLFTAID